MSDFDKFEIADLTWRLSAVRKQLEGFMSHGSCRRGEPGEPVNDVEIRDRDFSESGPLLSTTSLRFAGHQPHHDVRPTGVRICGEDENAAR